MEANILNCLESVLTSQNAFKDNAPRFNEAGQKLLLSIKTLKEVFKFGTKRGLNHRPLPSVDYERRKIIPPNQDVFCDDRLLPNQEVFCDDRLLPTSYRLLPQHCGYCDDVLSNPYYDVLLE
jgi:hypothetical protein